MSKYINLKFIFSLIFVASFSFVSAQDEHEGLDSLNIIDKRDSLNNRRYSLSAYPYAFYRPETEFAAGVGGVLVFYTNDDKVIRPSKIESSVFYTTNNQYAFKLKSGIYLSKNKLYIETPLSIASTLDKYWGVGSTTKNTGNEAYLREDIDLNILLQAPPVLFFADMTGINFEFNRTNIIDIKDNTLINDSLAVGSEGGDIFGVGINLLWDRRDHIFYPTKGNYQTFNFVVYPEPSEYVYTKFELDVRYYMPIKTSMVLASNFYYHTVRGDAPFYKLPALGGQYRLRGYFQGRYRDKNLVVFQTEFRHFVAKRWAYVVFAGVGDVSNDLTEMSSVELKYSFGSGLRYLFNKKEGINLRMDIGYTRDKNVGVYFGLTEAF